MVKIAVVGSISTDFVATSNRQPDIGETIYGDEFKTTYGGKGANQAVATARLGAETMMIGCVGNDVFGPNLISNLTENNIDTTHVKTSQDNSSGSAVINVVEGDNAIIYIAGANNEVFPEDIEALEKTLSTCNIVMVQNETPVETVERLITLCNEIKIPVLLNPAPARLLDLEYIEHLDYLTPNTSEFEMLFEGQKLGDILKKYPNKIIVTLGSDGAAFHDGEQLQMVPSYVVHEVVDTTGAGDTFNGALAVAIANGFEMIDAVRFANLAAAISIQSPGAQTGIPTIDRLKESEYYEETWHVE